VINLISGVHKPSSGRVFFEATTCTATGACCRPCCACRASSRATRSAGNSPPS
jgi:hypothetical protein